MKKTALILASLLLTASISRAEDCKVNVNAATPAQIAFLIRTGPVLAERIVAARPLDAAKPSFPRRSPTKRSKDCAMRTQEDQKVRLVALDNLRAMCDRQSSMCHRFWVEKVTRSRVHVAYSNPNEYGSDPPVIAVFPAIPAENEPDNPRVLLGHCLRLLGGRDEYDRHIDMFSPVQDCPQLWRSNGNSSDWKTREEWEAK